jgi:hypothetical protein
VVGDELELGELGEADPSGLVDEGEVVEGEVEDGVPLGLVLDGLLGIVLGCVLLGVEGEVDWLEPACEPLLPLVPLPVLPVCALKLSATNRAGAAIHGIFMFHSL